MASLPVTTPSIPSVAAPPAKPRPRKGRMIVIIAFLSTIEIFFILIRTTNLTNKVWVDEYSRIKIFIGIIVHPVFVI